MIKHCVFGPGSCDLAAIAGLLNRFDRRNKAIKSPAFFLLQSFIPQEWGYLEIGVKVIHKPELRAEDVRTSDFCIRHWFQVNKFVPVISDSAEALGAEDEGFEPSIGCPIHAFQACALGRYANPPAQIGPKLSVKAGSDLISR